MTSARNLLARFALARRIMALAAVLGSLCAARTVCAGQDGQNVRRQKQVLAVYATRRDAQLVVVGDRDLPRTLENGLSEDVDYYSEFIDEARYSNADYEAVFRDYLRLKYEGHRFDVVVAMDDVSHEFLSDHRDNVFPGTALVFYSSRLLPRRPANSTGVIAELNLHGTLALVTQLQPDVRHVFVVNGTDKTYESVARAQFKPFEQRLSISYLSGLPTKELEARLASLPEHSIVYYMSVSRDGADANFHPLEYVDRIVAAANAPTYTWVDSLMDRGVVGGSLKSQRAQADALGGLALRVLRGEPADAIPTLSADLNVIQVDWRQLRRWGIGEARVPAGTLVRFREPSAWDRYSSYILAAIGLVIAQAALIAGLLLQASKRRRAEQRLLASQEKLRASHARISELNGRLLLAQEAERSRIARELHDDVGQQIALVAGDVQTLCGLNHEARQDFDRYARAALDRVHGLSKSVHEISHRLHPAKLGLTGLVSAIDGLQHELSRPGVTIAFTHENVPSDLPQHLTLCVFRVIQEALQNAIKHGSAHEILVHLSGSGSGLTLTVVDDGLGFDVNGAFGKGLGLISMQERLEAVRGSLKIRSAPGTGTRLKVVVPMEVGGAMEAAAV